jgi:PAS domain S-box-containing protein
VKQPVPPDPEAALVESEARLRAILDTAVEGIVTINERGVIESFNAAAEKIFGWRAEEVLGRNVAVLMPAPYREEHNGYIDRYCRTGQAKIIGIGREVVGQRKDGAVFPMDLSVSEVRLPGRRIFTGFIRDITERKQMERQILEISDREQRRIGHDLHDGICQHLAGIELMAQVLEQNLAATRHKAAAQAGEIARHVRDTIQQTRALAHGLAPVVQEDEGLASALRELAETTSRMFRVACEFHCPAPAPLPDHAAAVHLFRIAQEAVSNAIKHGKAPRVEIHLRAVNARVVLMVKDHGTGLPRVLPRRAGMGLRIMQYRAGAIGASLAVQRDPDGGTSVVCSLQTSTSGSAAPAHESQQQKPAPR